MSRPSHATLNRQIAAEVHEKNHENGKRSILTVRGWHSDTNTVLVLHDEHSCPGDWDQLRAILNEVCAGYGFMMGTISYTFTKLADGHTVHVTIIGIAPDQASKARFYGDFLSIMVVRGSRFTIVA